MRTAVRVCLALLVACAPFGAFAQDEARVPPGVDLVEVTIPNGDVTLSGVIAKPPALRPLACVVLVHGSDQHERLTPFAADLAREGVAALTYDKRGRGKSTGTFVGPEVGSSIEQLPPYLKRLRSDVAAAFDFLAKDPSMGNAPCGLLGTSQAGWLIPFVAAERPAVKFIVLWSGTAVTLHEQLKFVEVTGGDAAFWQRNSSADARKLFEASSSRFQFEDIDPRPALARLTIPELWLFGGRDVLVPTELSVERLAAREGKGQTQIDYRVLTAAPHNLPYRDAKAMTLAWIRSVAFSVK
jgi:pimeloyl-ACP methyl ester carboxylesterase